MIDRLSEWVLDRGLEVALYTLVGASVVLAVVVAGLQIGRVL